MNTGLLEQVAQHCTTFFKENTLSAVRVTPAHTFICASRYLETPLCAPVQEHCRRDCKLHFLNLQFLLSWHHSYFA